MPFTCTICEEESTRICVWCTKDTCPNHLCQKCGRCSDCCECEVPLDEPVRETAHEHAIAAHAPDAQTEPALPPEMQAWPDIAAHAGGAGIEPASDSVPGEPETVALAAFAAEALQAPESEARPTLEPDTLPTPAPTDRVPEPEG